MILIENCIVSDDIITEKFCCDLESCKGACCVLGDAGAPLTEEEIETIDIVFDTIKPLMTEKGLKAVEQTGTFDIDIEGEYMTPLVESKECAYCFFDSDNIAKCVFEKAYFDGLISFRKPISCHLYPIRISKLNTYEAVNYHEWDVCKSARKLGVEKQIRVLDFLKEPLEKRYGKELYQALKMINIK